MIGIEWRRKKRIHKAISFHTEEEEYSTMKWNECMLCVVWCVYMFYVIWCCWNEMIKRKWTERGKKNTNKKKFKTIKKKSTSSIYPTILIPWEVINCVYVRHKNRENIFERIRNTIPFYIHSIFVNGNNNRNERRKKNETQHETFRNRYNTIPIQKCGDKQKKNKIPSTKWTS